MKRNLIVLISLCAALNLILGTAVYLLKLPIYLDMIGTITCALIIQYNRRISFLASASAGVISFVIGGLFNPFLPWFSGTAISVAAITAFFTGRWIEDFCTQKAASARFVIKIVGFGVLTGVVAALVSAPVVVILFGGVTGSGSAAIVAFFLKMGNQLIKAVVLSGLTADPIDKTIQLFLSIMLIRATPESFIKRFSIRP